MRASPSLGPRKGTKKPSGPRKEPEGILPGDRRLREIMPPGPRKGPEGVLPVDRWRDFEDRGPSGSAFL